MVLSIPKDKERRNRTLPELETQLVRERHDPMPISDKTRKILWARSGNRCASCRCKLVVDATVADPESVVGDECHIVSRKALGPRYDPAFPVERIDDADNLVLFCRVHHKIVDDQVGTYTVDVLRQLKENHEKWASSVLNGEKSVQPVRLRRLKENIPTHLVRLQSGLDVFKIVDRGCAFSFDHDEPHSETEVELLSAFLQEAQDWGDLSADLEAGERVRAAFRISSALEDLERAGFWVFGEREVRRLEGGDGASSEFPVSILRVVRSTNPEIVKLA
jgi:hypothetical protein